MKKNTLILFFVSALFVFGFVQLASAQSDGEKQEKRAEKFRQKIKSYGTGEKAKIVITQFDGNITKGYISESNDISLTLIDKSGVSKTLNYTEIKDVRKQSGNNKLLTGIVVGVGATIGIIVAVIFNKRANN